MLAGTIGAEVNEIPWPLTQQGLGEVLGLTAVHVNRTLQELRALGLVQVKSRLARLDVPGLYRLAHPLLDIFERQRPEYGAREMTAAA